MSFRSTTVSAAPLVDAVPKVKTCPFCGKELRRTAVSFSIEGKRRTASGLPVFGSCGCRESHRILNPERKLSHQEILHKYAEAGIPRDYWSVEVDCADVVSAVSRGLSVYIWGSNGTGKTATACCAAKRLMAEGKRIAFGNVAKIEADFRASDGANVDHLVAVPVLVLDDLGKESGTSFTAGMVYTIVNERAANNRPTIFTANKTVGELGRSLGDADTGRAVASRLSACVMKQLNGADRRSA